MNRVLIIVAVVVAFITVPQLTAQKPPELNDGEAHGDPPFLLEDGWRPLFNGKDLTGWHAQDGKPSTWLTTRGIRWERLLRPTQLIPVPIPGDRMLNGSQGHTANLVTDEKFGDVELYLEFMIPKGSNSGVYLMGHYEIQILDSWGLKEPKYSDCGGIYCQWIDEKPVGGRPPDVNACRPPGEWQSYDVVFRAPRFDGDGKKTADAKFETVVHNGQVIHTEVEVGGPTRASMPGPEKAEGPLMLQGDHGPVAYRNVRIRPLD